MKKLIALMMAVCLLASMMTFAAAEEQPVRRFKYKRTSMEVTVGDHTVKGSVHAEKHRRPRAHGHRLPRLWREP